MRASLLALLVMTTSATPPPTPPKRPPQQPEPGRLREVARTQSYTLGRPFHLRPGPKGQRVWFLRADATDPVADLFAFEPSTGTTRKVLSAKTLLSGREERLSIEELAARERKRIKTGGFTEFQLGPSGERLLLTLDGRMYLFDAALDRAVRIDLPPGTLLTPRLSPDGSKVAFVLDHDLAVVELPSDLPDGDALALEPRMLTRDGTEVRPNGVAEFVAQEEMSRHLGFWWSPTGDRILFQKNDEAATERFAIADAAHPERPVIQFPYPRPGRANVDVRLFVVPTKGGEPTEIVWDRERYPYVAKVVWQTFPAVLAQARDQRSQVFLRIDPETGVSRPLFEERDEAWLNIHDTTPRFSADGQTFLWATEEGGAWRLERKRLSEDGWSVVSREVVVDERAGLCAVTHVDEGRERVWLTGGPDPAQLHLYQAPLDGTEAPVPVTEGVGWNEVSFSADGSLFTVTSASLTALPEVRVMRVVDGAVEPAGTVPQAAETPDALPRVELVPQERAGGFRAAIVRPEGFRAGQKYPVVLHVYGGPGFSVVKAHAAAWFVPQWIADHGFVVVSLDGRGTPRRGRDFERALRERFHEVPLEDQVAGLTALAASFPELDLERVGVYGWSFGGYMSALSVLRRPDVFKAAVAGAPVVDWMYYDTHYTERYLGVPGEEPSPAYSKASLLSYAAELERPLMLVHGVADDNVYFAHSLQLADALFRENKRFELVPLVGLTHQVADPEVREALFRRIVSFLGESLW